MSPLDTGYDEGRCDDVDERLGRTVFHRLEHGVRRRVGVVVVFRNINGVGYGLGGLQLSLLLSVCELDDIDELRVCDGWVRLGLFEVEVVVVGVRGWPMGGGGAHAGPKGGGRRRRASRGSGWACSVAAVAKGAFYERDETLAGDRRRGTPSSACVEGKKMKSLLFAVDN